MKSVSAVVVSLDRVAIAIEILRYLASTHIILTTPGPCGLMDKAPDFGSGDCRFESCHGRSLFSTDPWEEPLQSNWHKTRDLFT